MSYYMPCVIQDTSEGLTRLPIRDMMMQRREIWLTGEIDTELADAVICQLLHLQGEDPEKEITMYINSPGGEVNSGMAVLDIMKAATCPIRTVCIGNAASMASVLFAAGHQRDIYPHSRVMIHDPLVPGGLSGSALQVQDTSQRLMKLRKEIATILAECTGKTLKEIYARTNKDTYFDADEAVAFGLADRVIGKEESP